MVTLCLASLSAASKGHQLYMPTLDWIGKKAVLNHHREVPYHLLMCDSKHSVGDPGAEISWSRGTIS